MKNKQSLDYLVYLNIMKKIEHSNGICAVTGDSCHFKQDSEGSIGLRGYLRDELDVREIQVEV